MPESAEPIECVRRVDFDECEVRAVDRVAAAGAAVAEAGADVDVGPDCEPPDEPGGAGRAVGGDEQAAHVAVPEREADLQQPGAGDGSGEHAEVAVERLGVGGCSDWSGGGHDAGSIRTVRVPPGRA